MKKILKRIKHVTFLAILTLASVGCGNRAKDLQGRWADVNSSTRLEIKGNKLIVLYGEWEDVYKYKVRTEYGTTYLANVKNDGSFGMMTELEICEDGSLRAYEMILDADSHQYRFVREEALEEEYMVQDLSRDLPKKIESRDVEELILYFDNAGGSYGLDESWESGHYSWSLTRRDDGNYDMKFIVTQSSYMAINYREEVSSEYVQGFLKLLEETGVIENNGYYMKNNKSSPRYQIYGEYLTGEELYIAAEGDPAKECIFDLKSLLDYAALLDLRYENE